MDNSIYINKKVCVSVNFDWVGKPTKSDDGKMYYNTKQVNLGYGWETGIFDWNQIFDLITKTGMAVGPALKEEANGNRNEQNFLSHSLCLVDVDNGMTIEQLLDDELYNKYGAGFYTTPSFTQQHHKFRIIFRLAEDITDANTMRHLYSAMIRYYGGDTACRDGARLFFGTVNAKFYERIDNQFLPKNIVDAFIDEMRQEELERFKNVSEKEYAPPTDELKQKILELLKQTYVGDYHIWRNVGWALRASGFDLSDYVYITYGFMNKKDQNAAKTIWDDYRSGCGITLGTVYHILRERYGEDCLQMPKQNYIDKKSATIARIKQNMQNRKNGGN